MNATKTQLFAICFLYFYEILERENETNKQKKKVLEGEIIFTFFLKLWNLFNNFFFILPVINTVISFFEVIRTTEWNKITGTTVQSYVYSRVILLKLA